MAATLVMNLLCAGIPPSLLMDLVDPEGMRSALAAELAEEDASAELASARLLGLRELPSRRVLGVA